MRAKSNPSFNKEYAQRVSKADFVAHFKDVYSDWTPEELGAKHDELNADKEVKAESKASKEKADK